MGLQAAGAELRELPYPSLVTLVALLSVQVVVNGVENRCTLTSHSVVQIVLASESAPSAGEGLSTVLAEDGAGSKRFARAVVQVPLKEE